MTQQILTGNHDDQDRKRQRCHYQLGAPTLVYEGNRTNERLFKVPLSKLPVDEAYDVYDLWKGRNRVTARWKFSLDMDQVDSQIFGDVRGRDKPWRLFWDDDDEENGKDDRIHNQGLSFDQFSVIHNAQQRTRLLMLRDANSQLQDMCVRRHASYEYPYAPADLIYKNSTSEIKEPRIKKGFHACTEEFGLLHRINDSSFLAPFDLDGITESLAEDSRVAFRKKLQNGIPEKLPQGNAILAVRCPCLPCSNRKPNERSWLLIHPKGPCLERFCVSNLVLPVGLDNAGHICQPNLPKTLQSRNRGHVIELLPNEVDLDSTILEVRQCGTWNVQIPQCLFVVRTGTHISVVNVHCKKTDYEMLGQASISASPSLDSSRCWGCYVVTEKERVDLRSLSRNTPSFRPVSISCHPRYGNAFVPAKFAFLSHTITNVPGQYNVVHSCTSGVHKSLMDRHDIKNLRHITHIDFTSNNPMCLWSAATSYTRPTLAPGVVAKIMKADKGPFGLGSSLYTIDLRSNAATFQWSPSAEELVTEGVHSISGILTDWDRENSVWVTSMSAGKTWEIDGRMPCCSVNSWSLTSICETTRVLTVPSKGFFGDGSLLTKTVADYADDGSNGASAFGGLPIVKVDTDVGSSGIHLFQRPQSRPRFQTESLECVAVPGINFAAKTSIASSAYFAVPEALEDVYCCGIASIRFPLNKFVEEDENICGTLLQRRDEVSVICVLNMNNNGDIYSHSLLECSGGSIVDSRRFEGLSVGTSSIPVPKNLDGRTKHLDGGHWKPTGGMNIRVFLSNSQPMPRDAKVSIQRLSKTRFTLSPAKTIKADSASGLVRIKRTANQPEVTIYSDIENHEMVDDGTQVKLPALLSNRVGTTMDFRSHDQYSDKQASENDVARSCFPRSDLSSSDIQGILDNWEGSLPNSDSELGTRNMDFEGGRRNRV